MTTNTDTKVTVQLTGLDSNIFNLLGAASGAMKRAGQYDEAKEMANKVFQAQSYDEALGIITTYVNAE